MNTVIKTMDDIAHGTRIGTITTLINDIAFQTNIGAECGGRSGERARTGKGLPWLLAGTPSCQPQR